MSRSSRARGSDPAVRTDWSAMERDLVTAHAQRLGVPPERLKAADRAADKADFERRFRDARHDVLMRWGSEIRAEAITPFRTGALERTDALVQVEDFVRGVGKHGEQVLILSGGTGLGKTLTALYGLAWFAARHPHLPFGEHVHAHDFAQRIRPRSKVEEANAVNMRAPFAVLDDFGQEDLTPRFLESADLFFNRRQGVMLGVPVITVITTNKAPSEIVERYGARVQSRFARITRGVVLTGDDMRTKARTS